MSTNNYKTAGYLGSGVTPQLLPVFFKAPINRYSLRQAARTLGAALVIAASILVTSSAAEAQVCTAQPGASGPGTVSALPNTYYPGTGIASAGSKFVGIGTLNASGNTTPVAVGDLVLIIQMQDASFSSSNSSAYGGSGPGQGYTSLNNAGAYEYASVAATGGSSITLVSNLLNTYTSAAANSAMGQRTFQVVRVPQYSSATLTGTVTTPPWNGSSGGVVAIDVGGQLTWGGGTIDVAGRGFRGGGGQASRSDATASTPALTSTDYVSAIGAGTINLAGAGSVPNGTKGEGVAGSPILVFNPTTPNNNSAGAVVLSGGTDGISAGYPQGSFARGAPGNGGGGGTDGDTPANDQNTGGGGGGSYGDGGTGGYGWTPGTPPGSQTGGFGGGGLPSSATRLFMGGGGGSGSNNDGTGTPANGVASSGVGGGGMVFVRAGSISGTATISAQGSSANNTVLNDASGGGGGGGQVLVFVNNGGGSISANINVAGGNGGSNTGNGSPHGPGGGGSGGFAALSGSATSLNVSGGINGTTATSATSTADYGSTSSPGGTQIVNLAATSIPGVSPSSSCLPRLTTVKTTSTPSSVAGGTATYTITITNQNGAGTASSVSINDPLAPTNAFTLASTSAITLGGTASRPAVSNPTAGATSPVWGTFTIPGGSSVAITFVVNLPTSVAPGTYNNNANVIYSDPTRTAAGQTVTPGGTYAGGGTVLGSNYLGTAAGNTGEDVTIRAPLTVAKSFNPTSIIANGSSVLQVVITNPNTIALTNVSVTDNYPAGLANAAAPAASSSCGGTIVANASGTSFAFSGGLIAASGTCTLQVTVTAAAAATYDNTIPASGVTSAENVSNAAAATGTLLGRPAIVKAFNSMAIAPNTNSTLNFTVTNPNSTQALSGLAFTDTYPTNLLNAAPLTVAGTCTGVTTTAAAGGGTFNVTAGNVPANSSCTITVQVTSSVAGNYLNTSGGATTTQTPDAGPPSNTAGLGVGLITISKAISPAVVTPGLQATITLKLSNPTGVAQTNAAFSDALANMSVDVGQTATVGGNAGCSGAAVLTAGQASINFSGINIPATPAIDTCTVTFTVSSVQVGTNPNTTSGVSSALLPAGPPSNTANLVVATKPTIAKSFAPSSVQANGTSQLTLTITNASSIALTGVSFTDAYPAGLINATPLAVGGTCSGVTTSATAGGNSFNVTAGTVPASASCTITIAVTSATAATYNNTTSGVATIQTGAAGSPSNTATLSVISPATIAKAFSPSPISQGGTSVLTFTVRNGNGVTSTNLNFTDTLVNMSVVNSTLGGTCGATSSPALTAGATGLNLTIPTLAGGAQCTVIVAITSSNPGSNPNVTSGVRSTEGPTAGLPSNSAVLDVLTAPVLQKAFVSNDILVGGTSTMIITVSNPNAVALTNATFTDALSNMTVNATTVSTTCAAGSAGLSFAPALTVGGTQFNPTLSNLAASESCTISVQIKSTIISPASGHKNTTSGATSTQTSVVPGVPASANLIVSGPPTITKQFVKTASLPTIVPETPVQVGTARATTIIFTLTNPDANVLSGGSFGDTFPAGMTTIAAAQTYTGAGRGTCTGAIPSASTGGAVGSVTFSGVNIPANASCTVFVDVTVTATSAGTITNNVSGVTTSQTPTAGPGASATLTALAAPTIVKKFSPTSTVGGAANPITLTLTLTNPNATALTGVSVTDVFPTTNGGMRVNSTTITPSPPCGAGSTITDNTGAALVAGTSLGIRLNGATLPANSSCTFSVLVQIQTTGANAVFTNTTGGVTSNETPVAGTTATDTVNRFAVAPLSITKSFSAPVVQTNSSGSANLILVISNSTGATQNITTSALDTFPTTPSAMQAVGGLTITGANCGSLTPTTIAANATSYQLTGGSLINGTTCTITIPIKVGVNAGTYANIVAGVTSNGNTSSGDSANLIAVAAPTITKAFAPATIGPGGVSTITFSITNSSATIALNNATFTDTLNNMSVATAGAAAGTCSGATSNTYTAGQSGSISVTGLTLPVNATCTVTLQVTSSTLSAALPNTTSGVTTTQTPVAGAGAPTANLAVIQASVNKAFALNTIDMGGTSTLTFTITNGAGNPAQTGLGFVDTLPTNVFVAATPAAGSTCPAGVISAGAGGGTISFSAGAMNSGQATCTVTVNVTSNVPGGPYNNTNANVTTSNLTNSVTSSGLTVQAQPALTKAFSTAAIGGGGAAVLTFTIANTGTGNTARAGLAFTDTLPLGLIVAATPGVTSNCPAGGAQVAGPAFVTSAAGGGTVTVSGASINAGATCTINVNVTNATNNYGTCPNSAFTNGQGNIGGVSSGASLLVTSGITDQCLSVSRTALTKAFAPATIQAGGVSTLTFSLNNGPGNPAQTGLSFIDSLPSGVVIAAVPNLKSNCPAGGGQVNSPAFLTAPAGGGTVTASAAAGMSAGLTICTISVDITAAAQGAYLNNAARISGLPASGAIDASGVNATLTALSLPLISKAFSPATINAGGTSTMTFTITNNNSVALTNGAFTDTLTNIRVSGLQNPPSGTCGATGSYSDQQTGAISFTIPSVASGTCTISLLVTSNIPGVLPNATSPISFTGPLAVASAAGSNTANLTVVGGSPTIAKAFSPTAIPNDGVTASTITFTLSNNNGIALTGVNFTDSLSNMSVAGAQTVGGTCAGAGSNSLTNNQTAISIAGVTIPANGGCTLTLTVKSTVVGVQPNTTSGVSSTQAATGPASNTANLTVQSRPALTKAFGAANVAVNGTTTLTFTIANTAAGNAARTGLNFTDTLTSGINIANPPAPTSVNCGAPTFTAANATQTFTVLGVDVAANAACTITLTVRGVTAGTTTNGPSDVTTSAGLVNGVATQTIGVYAPATATKTIAPASIAPGTNATLSLTLTNPAANPGALTTVQVDDTFPAGLTLANTSFTFAPAACGTVTKTSGAASVTGDNNVRFQLTSLAAGATCQVGVSVTSSTAGTVTNTTAAPTASGPVATSGTAASASLTVTALIIFSPDLQMSKTSTSTFVVGSSASFTLTPNNSAGSAATTGVVTVTDTLPSGLTYVATGSGGAGWTCSVSSQVVTCTTSAVIAAGATGIAITVNVAVNSTAVPSVTNVASVSGGGETAGNTGNNSALLTVPVSNAPVNTFTTDGAQTALPGTSVFYPHTFNAGSAGTVSFATTQSPNPNIAGWGTMIFRDFNCNGTLDGADGTAPLAGTIAVNPGDQICIIVRNDVPAGAPFNAQDVATSTATFTPSSGPSINYTRQDVTTVVLNGGLTLTKSVRNITQGSAVGTNNTAKPGDVLEYIITYTNSANAPVSMIVVTDATPVYTTFVSAVCNMPLPAALTGCSFTAPTAGASGSVVWTLNGSLNAMQAGTVALRVMVQ